MNARSNLVRTGLWRSTRIARHVVAPEVASRRQQVIARRSAATFASRHTCTQSVLAAVAAAGTVLVAPKRPVALRARGMSAVPTACAAEPSSRVVSDGDEVLVEYTGRLQDGTVFDSSEEGDLLTLSIGSGDGQSDLESALGKAIQGLRIGDCKAVTLSPEEAYGPRNERLVFTLPASQVPKGLEQGMRVMFGVGGQPRPATISAIKEDGSVVVDANAPLAGKTLVFDIKVVGFKEPPVRGMQMIGWQGKSFVVPGAIANSPVSKVFQDPQWPATWPYKAGDFRRQDESGDDLFYAEPRFVTHIDDGAISAIRDFYACHFSQAPQGEYSILDICSSWISHYPKDLCAKRVAITGMVQKELVANKQATEYRTKNLNSDPTLPYDDNEFDFITNVVSVDYITKPREIFLEMHRVLKPGGVAIMSFSNRCFASKAIKMWVANMSDGPGHCQIVGNYFHFNPEGGWRSISSADISSQPGRSDPMWVVTAVKA